PEVSYTNTGGFLSTPWSVRVSARLISRMGTRISARDPVTYILRELGMGWVAAPSAPERAMAVSGKRLVIIMLHCMTITGNRSGTGQHPGNGAMQRCASRFLRRY